MKTKLLSCLLGTLAFLGSALTSQAQNVETLLQVMTLDRRAEAGIVYLGTEKSPPSEKFQLPVARTNLQPAKPYKGPRKFNFYTEIGPEAEPLTAVTLPSGASRVIIVLIPRKNSNGETRYESMAINATDGDFERGGRAIFNFSPYPIRIEYGKLPFKKSSRSNIYVVCPPNKKTLVKNLGQGGKRMQGYQAIMEFNDGKAWKRFRTPVIYHDKTKRMLVFAYYDAKQKGIVFNKVADFMQTEKRS